MASLLRIEKLPLILAGPMVRRVTLDTVGVWVVLKEARNVKLSVWKGRQKADATGPLFEQETKTVAIGANLHLAMVQAKRPVGSLLEANTEYSYNLTLKKEGDSGTGDTLKSLGLLAETVKSPSGPGGNKVLTLPLGYKKDELPSFLTPPADLKDYRLAHASCRLAY